MSHTDPYTFLKTLITKEEAENRARISKTRTAAPLVVTLSRDYGAGGETIAQKLGNCLGIPVHDSMILELAAQKAHVDPSRFRHPEEPPSSGISSFIYSLLTGTNGEPETYRRALYGAVLELAQKDGLLVGRGAHLILSGKHVFRVRIVGSRLVCAQRVAKDLGITLQAAERKVFEINNKRHKSIDSLFKDSCEHCSLSYAKNFDLIINTDHIEPINAVPIIMLALQQGGFDLQRTSPAGAQ